MKNPPKLGAGLNFCNFTLGSRNHQKKKTSFARLFVFFSLLLAQSSELLPPVLVVETPHVAVHILFHSRIEASIRLASIAQAFWNISFQMRPDFV